MDPLLLAAVTAWCAQRDVLANSLSIESRTLEDVFLELTGKELRRDAARSWRSPPDRCSLRTLGRPRWAG